MRSVLMSSNVGSSNVILCNIPIPIRDVAQIDIPTYVWGSFIDVY